MAKRNKRGQPPKYKTAKELIDAVHDYFVKGVPKRKVVIGPSNNRTTVLIPVPTITGLALYLGFCSRQSFYDLEKRKEFSYAIKRARSFIECEYEEQLQTNNVAGAIFALKNMGWVDKIDNQVTGDFTVTVKRDG
jgi:hypothetical protein